MRLQQKEFGAMIVALGKFSPSQITPAWLKEKGLIGGSEQELASSDRNLAISHDFTQYSTDWFNLSARADTLIVGSTERFSDAVKDLADGLIANLVSSEISAIGVNFYAHYHVADIKDYYRIGDTLVPKSFWSDVFGLSQEDSAVGLQALHLRIDPFTREEAEKGRKLKDYRRLFVEGSAKVSQGVYFLLNQHFDFTDAKDQYERSELARQTLNDHWDSGVIAAPELFERILTKAAEAQ